MEQVKAIAGTLLRTFVVAMLGQVLAFGVGVLDFTGNDWRVVLAAGIAAVLKVAYNALNADDPRYGRVGEVA